MLTWTLLVWGDKPYAIVDFGGTRTYQRLVDEDGDPNPDPRYWSRTMRAADALYESEMRAASRRHHNEMGW